MKKETASTKGEETQQPGAMYWRGYTALEISTAQEGACVSSIQIHLSKCLLHSRLNAVEQRFVWHNLTATGA